MRTLSLRGARAHNLKDLDLELPLGAWIAVTGPSGSGKTSLAFDVIHREGQRRYLGALSARARQYLDKLGPAEVDAVRGLPVTAAAGQAALRPDPRSTVGTRSGLLDLLRLLYARAAAHPLPLRRSLFSFNTPDGACPTCGGLGVEDHIHPPSLIADASRSLRQGALRPTLPSGYTVYSQVTLEVMDLICRAHGFDVDTPWAALSEAQRRVILYGTRALRVPFGKHSLASRMKWSGITARPREEGYYRGLIPVMEETLRRDRNKNILRYARSFPCAACGGARLGPVGREAQIGGVALPALLALPAAELGGALAALPPSPPLAALRPPLEARLGQLERLSLGHLSLDRPVGTLSGGEGQRLGLVTQLSEALGGRLIVLDEPTLGLHPEAQPGMAAALEALRAQGNTLLVVDHDPHMVQRADHWLRLGPGAGPEGGRVLYSGPMPDGALPRPAPSQGPPPADAGALRLVGARLRNLEGVDLEVPLRALTVVSGPSGAGKSSLVFDTLLPALQGEEGGPYERLEGAPEGLAVRWVDARPLGRTPRSTPATYTGLFDVVRRRFAALPEAQALGLGVKHFSYNTPDGRCPACEGLGVQRVGMHLLRDVEQPCPACGGGRYAPESLAVRLGGRTVAEVLALTAGEAVAFFEGDDQARPRCEALARLGLGYLQLGQPSSTLSRGESQRVKLAALLGSPPRGASLVLLDEPDRGLHPDDVLRLLACLEELVRAGHTVLAISHHPMVWAAAHRRVALRGGRLAPPCPFPGAPAPPPRRTPAAPPAEIVLRGVRTHNLRGVDVRIPHGAITVITGVSGSGKSSLAFDTLAALAWSRFAEGLPARARRFIRQQPAPVLESAEGLTPALSIRQGQGRAGPRSTAGTLSGLDATLRLLFSRLGERGGAPAGLSAAHFSANQVVGACPACEGLGAVERCDPGALITDPSLPLGAGAMAGTKPGRFFGEAGGQHMATLAAAAAARGLAPGPAEAVPWEALAPAARALALEGAGEQIFEVSWAFSRGKRAGTHTFTGPWRGLRALVEEEARKRAQRKDAADWAAPLRPAPCGACGGERLSPAARAVRALGWRLPELQALRLTALRDALEAMSPPPGQRPVLDALRPGASRRLETLTALGLGHLSLDRPSESLSTGELQRLRLAGVLESALTGLTLVLDEPGAGLDDAALVDLCGRLRRLCEAGNTVVAVSHRRALVAAADRVLTLGPGAGERGGQLLDAGPPTPPAAPAVAPVALPADHGWIRLEGARARTLQGFDLALPDRGLVAITGPSGSGKSTLLFEVLGASAAAGRAAGCARVSGLERFQQLALRRAAAPRSPLDAFGLMGALQDLFHSAGSDLPRRAFSFRSPAGRCPTCKGSGLERTPMDFMADLVVPCPACEGRRYAPEVLAVRWRGLDPAALLALPAWALLEQLPGGPLARAAAALIDLGLGYLPLGRPAHSLSGGEARRIGLAAALAGPTGAGLYLLDEPGAGLHEQDLERLVAAMQALAARGGCLIYTTHRRRLRQAAGWQIALGPGGGDEGGRLVRAGPPQPA
jgi:excinuclease ABC subunit A